MHDKNNLNLGFPFDYRDTPENDDNRLSHLFVKVVSSKKFQNICSALFFIGASGIQSPASANAFPAEAGEHIAAAADAAVNSGTVTCDIPGSAAPIAGAVANEGHKALPNLQVGNKGNFGGLPPAPLTPAPAPGQPPIYMPLPRPITPVSRTLNTAVFTGSFAYICLNAYWGNPVAIAGCNVMVATWFFRVLGSRYAFLIK